jgi:predicted outer membrane protein
VLTLAAASCAGPSHESGPSQIGASTQTTGAPVEPGTTPALDGQPATPPTEPVYPSMPGERMKDPLDTSGATPVYGDGQETKPTPPAMPRSPAPGAAPATASPASLTDGEILAAVVAAHQAEHDRAHEALKKAKDPRVLELARQMLRDEETIAAKIKTAEAKSGIAEVGSTTQEEIRVRGSRTVETLASPSLRDFDQAFLDAEVVDLDQTTGVMTTTLVPQAQSSPLKELLKDAREDIARHRAMAHDLRSSLK